MHWRTSLLASLGRAEQILAAHEEQRVRLKVQLRIEDLDVVRQKLDNIQEILESSLKSLQLPTITLSEFNGDYIEWLAFYDTFLALIHSDQDVPEIQKFHYLKSSVPGEDAQIIESFAISAANYQLAWQICQRISFK